MTPRLPFNSARWCFGFVLILILAAGCGPQQAVKPSKPAPPPGANAEARLRNGDFLNAAAEFARLSTSDPTASSRYRAMAALAYIDGDDPDSAATLLSEMPADTTETASLSALALAAIDTLGNGSSEALRQLELVEPRKLNGYQKSVYYRTLGRVSMFNRSYSDAATAFIAADEYVLPKEKRNDLHNDIWRALSHMDDTTIHTTYENGSRREKDWLELAIGVRPNLHNSVALADAIESWQSEHPQHAANLSLIETLYELSESLSAQSRHVALLLPFDGTYGTAATAIRDGFLSAWYASPKNGNRPTVSVYSVDASRVNGVYDMAVANGADLIVGPLEKSAVETLIARGELPVRTLTLNVVDRAVDPSVAGDSARLFQFALSPEDEAADAAEKARSEGHSRAVVLAPETPWGQRLTQEFAGRWKQLGGVVLAQTSYGGKENSYAESVKRALNIDKSELRAKALRQALNRTIRFEPRRRADVDAIFMAGFPVSTRQLVPHLRYFRAESVPVYSTSHTYTGVNNSAADQDLDGLRFGDMPWLFGAADHNTYTLFNRSWSNSAPGSGRLFAFGLDAYRILPYLARMRYQPGLRIPGVSGQLRMNPNGRVIRELTWARFASGIPTLIDR